MAKKAGKFQVKLLGDWKDYGPAEDKILKRAYLAGFPNAKYKLRGQEYQVDFKKNVQLNVISNKPREIRPPYSWKQPAKPITKSGKTFVITVPLGSPGKTIEVPHPVPEVDPSDPEKKVVRKIAVTVPDTAKPGQAMLVPIPAGDLAALKDSDVKAEYKPPTEAEEKKSGYSTGYKVAAATGGAMVVGGLAVGGAVLGAHMAEEGWDAGTLDELGAELGDAATAAGEAVAEGAETAVDWVGETADTAGDFIMDLF